MAIEPEEKGHKGVDAVPDINVTPLIDVLLVLLIIFMVLTPVKQYKLESKVPERAEGGTDVVNPLVIVIGVQSDPQGRVTGVKVQDDEPISVEALDQKLPGIIEGLPSDRRTVFIRAAQNAIYGEVVRVIDIAKKAGASPIGLQIDDLPDQ